MTLPKDLQWVSVNEATQLAHDYIELYDPETHNVAIQLRSWVVEVTGDSALFLINKSRIRAGVDARTLWATAMWNAGYSYPQIARAQNRENHSSMIHLLRSRRHREEIIPYLEVAKFIGAKLGKFRLEWVDKGDAARKRRFRNSLIDFGDHARRLRIEKLQQIESNLARVEKPCTEKLCAIPPIKEPKDSDMRDLAASMMREAGQ